MTRLLPLLALACQPAGEPEVIETTTCLTTPPVSGVWVQPRQCGEQTPPGGEGTVGDLVLANAEMRAILRQPAHALTVPGIGGGTLVDIAPWGHGDILHEAIPIVGGGWLELDTYTILEDGLHLAGAIRPLLDRPVAGERGSVTWTIDPEVGLHLEGAEALWLNPHAGMRWEDGALTGPETTLLMDGALREDLGGARILEDLTAIRAVPTASRWAEAPDATHISGLAEDASHLVLSSSGEEIERWSIDGTFDGWVPATVDRIRAIAPDRAPSEWTAPGQDLVLSLGAEGWLRVEGPGPMAVRWRAEGRSGLAVVEPGDSLAVGAGLIEVEVDGAAALIDVPDGGEVTIQGTGLPDRGNWLRADLDLRASRHFRSANSGYTDALQSWVDGARFGVLQAENDVGDPTNAAMATATGSRMAWEGWTVDAFPWSGTARRGAHGALDPALVPIDSVIAAMRGGPGTDRATVVDLTFLEAHGPFDPEALLPDAVRLADPEGDPASAWANWLMMPSPSRPVGPVTWLWTPDPDFFGELEVRRALARGHTVAGTGVWMTAAIDGDPRATSLPTDIFEVEVTWEGVLDEVILLDGSREIARWDGVRDPWVVQVAAESIVAIGWSDAGDWVVTTVVQRPDAE